MQIQFYNLKDNPRNLLTNVNLDRLSTFEDGLTEGEKSKIESSWTKRLQLGYKDNELGSLWSTLDGLVFMPVRFKTYDAVTQHLPIQKGKVIPYSMVILEQLRTSAVGCVLETIDGYIVVQRRGTKVLAHNKLDSSASGMVVSLEGKLDFEAQALNKLEKELGISRHDLEYLVPTGIHRALDYGTAQFTFAAKTMKTLGQIREDKDPECNEDLDKSRTQEIKGIELEHLPSFIIDHATRDLIGDGIATLLKSINNQDIFGGIISTLKLKGINIVSGTLKDGIFIEDCSLDSIQYDLFDTYQ